MKKCKKCGIEKDLSEFHVNRAKKDGKETKCKGCIREAVANRKYKLTCQNPECGVEFVNYRKDRKYCHDCYSPNKTQEQIDLGEKKCTKCKELKDFSQFYDTKGVRDGKESQCKQCKHDQKKANKKKFTCQHPDCGEEFESSQRNKFCPKCQPKNRYIENIKRQAKNCSRCGKSFECKANDIEACHCYSIKLSSLDYKKIAQNFTDCLCQNCLKDIIKK